MNSGSKKKFPTFLLRSLYALIFSMNIFAEFFSTGVNGRPTRKLVGVKTLLRGGLLGKLLASLIFILFLMSAASLRILLCTESFSTPSRTPSKAFLLGDTTTLSTIESFCCYTVTAVYVCHVEECGTAVCFSSTMALRSESFAFYYVKKCCYFIVRIIYNFTAMKVTIIIFLGRGVKSEKNVWTTNWQTIDQILRRSARKKNIL